MAGVGDWILKSDPGTYGWDDLVRDVRTRWDGVRNFQARNHLRAMRPGDRAFVYHSGGEKRIVGIARIASAPYPDPADCAWTAVDLEAGRPLGVPLDLARVRSDPVLRDLPLVRQVRLSVSPVTPVQARRILALGSA